MLWLFLGVFSPAAGLSVAALPGTSPGGLQKAATTELRAALSKVAPLPVEVAEKVAELGEPSAGDVYLGDLQQRFKHMLCVPPYQAAELTSDQHLASSEAQPVASCYDCAAKCKHDCLAYQCIHDHETGEEAHCTVFKEGALSFAPSLDARLGGTEQERTLCVSQGALLETVARPPALGEQRVAMVHGLDEEPLGLSLVAGTVISASGPAAAAGLQPGDQLTAVNGTPVAQVDITAAVTGEVPVTFRRLVRQDPAMVLKPKPHHLGDVASDLYVFSWHKAFQFVTGLTSIAATVWGTSVGGLTGSAISPVHNYLAFVIGDVSGVEDATEQKVDQVLMDLNQKSEEVGRQLSQLTELISFAHSETQALIPARKLFVQLQTELLNHEIILAKRDAAADAEFEKLWAILVELHPYIVGGPLGKPLFLVQMEKMAAMVTADLGGPALVSALLAMRTTFSSVLISQLRGAVLLARMLPHCSVEHRGTFVAHVVRLLEGLAVQKRSCDPAGSPAFQATVAFAFDAFGEKLAAAYVADIATLEEGVTVEAAEQWAAARAARPEMPPAWHKARASWIGQEVDVELLEALVGSEVPFVLAKDSLRRAKTGFIAALREATYDDPTRREEERYAAAKAVVDRDTVALRVRPFVCDERIATLTSLVEAAVLGQDTRPFARELGSMLCDVERGWLTEQHEAHLVGGTSPESPGADAPEENTFASKWRKLYNLAASTASLTTGLGHTKPAPARSLVRKDVDGKLDALLEEQAVLRAGLEQMAEEQEHQTTLQEAIVSHLGASVGSAASFWRPGR